MSAPATSDFGRIKTAPLGLLVVQPTTFCNIDCRYCYLSQRGENHRMSEDTLAAVARFVRDIPLRDQRLALVWHAGEPLTLPVSFYETAFNLLQNEGAPVEIEHHIQTNALLIDDRWCALFKKWNVRVGVSIDGPKEVNDAQRVDRAGRGTFDKVMRGINKLKEHSIPFSVIGVLTRESIQMPDEIWRFFESLNTTQIGFNVEEREGINLASSLAADDPGPFRQFVRRMAQLRKANPSCRVREFDGMRSHMAAPPGSAVERADLEPGAIINIDYRGDVTTFSPELLGVTHDTYGDFRWGNVHQQSWSDVLAHPRFLKAFEDIKAGVENCRDSCSYFSVCGGGNPSNKLTELGSFRGAETQYCRLHVQAFADIVLEEIEQELSSQKPVEKILTSEPGNTQEPPQKHAVVDIYLTGAGVAFPDHLTVETIEILTSCKRIATNLQEFELEKLPEDLKSKCVSLWSLYQDRRFRTDNYNDVFHTIVEMAEIERPIAWLTPGHPVIFDSVTASLLQEGKKRDWNIRVIPAISSVDTLLAELGYDPAHGMLIHECTGLVRRRVPLDRTLAAMLLQPSVFDIHVAVIKPGGAKPDLGPLRDYIAQFHVPDHRCAFIRSSPNAGERDLVTWVPLKDMATVPYERIAGSTLFIPPAA